MKRKKKKNVMKLIKSKKYVTVESNNLVKKIKFYLTDQVIIIKVK